MPCSIKSLPAIFLLLVILAHVGRAVAQINRGTLDATSSGQLQLNLEIRANSRDGVSISTPGREFLPVRLPPVVARALANRDNANFPLCVALQSGQSLQVLTAEQPLSLVDETGESVPYKAALVPRNGRGRGAGNAGECETGQPMNLQIELDTANARPGKRVLGNIFVILKNE